MAVVAIVVLLGTLVAVLAWFLQPSRNKKITEPVPGPPTLPLVGNAHLFKPGGNEFFQQIVEFSQLYKDEPYFRILVGPRIHIVLKKAQAVEIVLNSSKNITKAYEYKFLHPWLGTGLLTSTNEKWKIRRRLLTPTFHFKILNDFLQVFNEQASILISKLDEYAGKGEFDIFNYVAHCALDIICETAMGKNVNAQNQSESAYVKAVYRMSKLIHIRQLQPWFWPDFMFNTFSEGNDFKKCLDILHIFTKQVISDRSLELDQQLASSQSHGLVDLDQLDQAATVGKSKRLAFLDMLLYAAKADSSLTEEDIREEVDTFMFEGHDTTAAAVNWAVHLIGSHPEVQKKLHMEVDEVFGNSDRSATMDDINKLNYLGRVIKEALRLFPSVPYFAREITDECKIGNQTIPKGVAATILVVSLHRDETVFPNPEQFDPDRFSTENAAERHPFAYVPFSAGPRNCIGQKFAMNEEKVLLSHILRRFNIESTQNRDELQPQGEIILRPKNGIFVKLTHRNK